MLQVSIKPFLALIRKFWLEAETSEALDSLKEVELLALESLALELLVFSLSELVPESNSRACFKILN